MEENLNPFDMRVDDGEFFDYDDMTCYAVDGIESCLNCCFWQCGECELKMPLNCTGQYYGTAVINERKDGVVSKWDYRMCRGNMIASMHNADGYLAAFISGGEFFIVNDHGVSHFNAKDVVAVLIDYDEHSINLKMHDEEYKIFSI